MPQNPHMHALPYIL